MSDEPRNEPSAAKGLITDPYNGGLSATKLWVNVAYFVATLIMLWYGVVYKVTPELLLIYLGVVASHAGASKWLSAKFATPTTEGK